MKSAILYPYGPLRGTGCCRMLHAKHLALTGAIYTLVSFSSQISLFIFLRCGAGNENTKLKINLLFEKFKDLQFMVWCRK